MNIQIDTLPPRLPDKSYVVLDVEIFNAERHRLHRPTGEFACVSCATSAEDVYVYTKPELIELLMGRLDNCILIFHNAQFDIQHLRRWAKVEPQNIWDTMLIEKLLYSGYYDKFSLKDLVRRYLGHNLDKNVRDRFLEAQELDEELIHYSALDAFYTYRVFEVQKQEVMKRKDVFKIWKKIDMSAIWAFSDFMGFRIDKDGWLELAKTNKQKAEQLKETFDFLPSSYQQVGKKLRETGFARLPSTGAKILSQWISRKPKTEAAEIAKRVLQYRQVAKLSSTYGAGWIKFMEQEDDDVYVIYANHKATHAETGRTAVDNPPLHNVPLRKNPEFRKPFIARPDHDLVVADWSAQEPFIHAYLSKDKRLRKIIKSKKDIYVETSRIFGKVIEKSDPYRNERIKPTYLGSIYGLTPNGMSERYNIPIEECEELKMKFREAFPESAIWCDTQREKSDYVETIMGRRFYLNTLHRQKEENALNMPHQGSGADMLKIALATLHKGWDQACPFGAVHQNHDEIILDVPKKYSKDAAHFLQKTMEDAGTNMVKGKIKFKASAKIVQNWLEAK